MKGFRCLTADEVDCRVSQVTPKGFTALLYKDARCDMRILDETVGPENWQREHYECKGNLFCRVGINIASGDEPPQWVWKSDCGAESYTEKEKGEASDSFKRACFNWGIGRELYTSPFIWIPNHLYKTKTSNGKEVPNVAMKVTGMEVRDGKITYLQIYDRKSNAFVYEYGESECEADPEYTCEDCGGCIVDAQKRNGEPWTKEDIVRYSKLRFGRTLCPNCQKKAFEAEEGKRK